MIAKKIAIYRLTFSWSHLLGENAKHFLQLVEAIHSFDFSLH
jgi:hypothetical protein